MIFRTHLRPRVSSNRAPSPRRVRISVPYFYERPQVKLVAQPCSKLKTPMDLGINRFRKYTFEREREMEKNRERTGHGGRYGRGNGPRERKKEGRGGEVRLW